MSRDPISPEMKRVGIAIFGERLGSRSDVETKTVERIARAIGEALWPTDVITRDRFASICMTKPEIQR